jgi:hypothetical protein
VSPVKYDLGLHIPEDGILHSDRRENLKSYRPRSFLTRWEASQKGIIPWGQLQPRIPISYSSNYKTFAVRVRVPRAGQNRPTWV